jgi:hypothetical protein
METEFTIDDGFTKTPRSTYPFRDIPIDEVGSQLKIILAPEEDLDKIADKVRNAAGIFKKANPEFNNLSVHVLRKERIILVHRGE